MLLEKDSQKQKPIKKTVLGGWQSAEKGKILVCPSFLVGWFSVTAK